VRLIEANHERTGSERIVTCSVLLVVAPAVSVGPPVKDLFAQDVGVAVVLGELA
jgi:hypothetical protein